MTDVSSRTGGETTSINHDHQDREPQAALGKARLNQIRTPELPVLSLLVYLLGSIPPISLP